MTFVPQFNDLLFGGFLLNSMNGEDPSRKRNRSMNNFQPLLCTDVRDMVSDGDDSILILDCRSFLAYNKCHISSAVNAYCPSILRRRSRGKLPFHVLIPSKDVREKLLRNCYSTVVLYEEPEANAPTSAAATVGEDLSSLSVVGRCLQQDGIVRNLYYLEGGFSKFRHKYPQLCAGSQQNKAVPSVVNWDPQADHSHHYSNNPSYEQGDPVEILPYVYLGSAFHAANQKTLNRLKITALLNVSKTRPELLEGHLLYKCIPVDDSGNAEISTWFHEAINYIEDVRLSGGKVLIHCHAGISRSATICLAYLMSTKRIRLEEAYEYVKKRRSVISPNLNFMGQLLKYECQLGLFSPTGSPSPHANPTSTSTTSPLHTFVAAMAAAASSNSKENCLRNAQRFVFDLAGAKDDSYPVSSPTPMLSPMCATPTPILSPS